MGRRGIRGRRVVPGTEQSTVPLTRPSRMAKWHLRKGDMMVFGPTDGGRRTLIRRQAREPHWADFEHKTRREFPRMRN
jgi:hypothetical protein